jgi:hypothetical protein
MTYAHSVVMTPASEIIERCGGPKTVADWLGLERTAVQRWTYPRPKGTGERVPMRHWSALIAAAAQHDKLISLAELMPPDVAKVARREERARSDAAA